MTCKTIYAETIGAGADEQPDFCFPAALPESKNNPQMLLLIRKLLKNCSLKIAYAPTMQQGLFLGCTRSQKKKKRAGEAGGRGSVEEEHLVF